MAASNVDWLESLSPWPRDGFGLGRMLTLLSELGNPQLEYPSIHYFSRQFVALYGVSPSEYRNHQYSGD